MPSLVTAETMDANVAEDASHDRLRQYIDVMEDSVHTHTTKGRYN